MLGVSASTSKQEIPSGPGPPVRHITRYTPDDPAPLIKAYKERRININTSEEITMVTFDPFKK